MSSSCDMSTFKFANRSKFSTNSPSSTYPFLVHSPQTLPFSLPPNVDNKPLARQKRKRTSPEDQAILEAEFLRDPRPDKAARCRIQERVALGDKEVQIWFQNRRQNTRRRAKPLEPHEVFSRLQSPPNSSPPTLGLTSQSSFHSNSSIEEIESISATLKNVEHNAEEFDRQHDQKSNQSIKQSFKSIDSDSLSDNCVSHQPQAGVASRAVFLNTFSTSPECTSQASVSGESRPTDTFDSPISLIDLPNARNETHATKFQAERELLPLHRKSAMNLRLSLRKDGNARIITGDESSPSPSPQKPPPTAPPYKATLRRTQSVALSSSPTISTAPTSHQLATPFFRHGTSGRSRDSRAWEFWCDSDARNELANKAAEAQSGSAAAAIGLMRSTSRGSGILAPNLAKLNASLQRRGGGGAGKRAVAPLRRSLSSVGRLQSVAGSGEAKLVAHDDAKLKKKGAAVAYSPSGDSDKENVQPEMQVGSGAAATLAGAQRRGKGQRVVLGDSTRAMGFGRPDGPKLQGDAGRRGFDAPEDEVLAEFMKRKSSGSESGSGSISSTGEDDLDCVQGLLSLSQGNWC